MITYTHTSVFNTNADAIVNTVNCLGVMGAGLALEFKLRYPNMFNLYTIKCKSHNIKVGKIDYYKDTDILIVNFPTKNHFKYPSQMSWIEDGLKDFVSTYKNYNIKSIAFPKLGTNNGGLDWNEVKQLMEKYLSPLDIDVYICLDDDPNPQGIELEMINYYNDNINKVISKVDKLKEAQKETLLNSIPIKRFWHISKLDGIGITTYEKIFNICYPLNKPTGEEFEQMSLFDDLK